MNLIPKPQSYKKEQEICNLANLIYYHLDDEIIDFKDVIYSILRLGLKRELEFKKGGIEYIFDSSIAKEGYILDVQKEKITIKASTSVGALWATQSLRILGEFDLEEPCLNVCKVEDYPALSWRGLLYDESRHFFGIEATKRLIDLMSLHKLNVLHWHLTDDAGWRVEIKKYPLLTQIGSKRRGTQINGWRSTDVDFTPHEGYYTQEQIKEIIKYAKCRGIMIVPEIDMPGHFSAAIAAYNDLACKSVECEVPYWFGASIPKAKNITYDNRPACVSKESTMEFIKNVVDEICDLFEAPYFHIGGDEVDMSEWKTCPICQEKMKKENITDVKKLQCNFINEIQQHVLKKNKRLMGWNEALKGDNLDTSILVQYWTAQFDKRVYDHLNKNGEIVISKHKYFYFDMPYAMYPLKNTYNFKVKKIVKNAQANLVKGIEGAMWAEWIPSLYKFDFQLFPRMEALAEVGWYQKDKCYTEFLTRLESFKPILNALKVNYAENQICQNMGLFKRIKYQKEWFNGDQNLELKENDKIKLDKNKD